MPASGTDVAPASNPEHAPRGRDGSLIETAATGPSEQAARTQAPLRVTLDDQADGVQFTSTEARDRAKDASLTAGDFTGQEPDTPAGFSLDFVEQVIAKKKS
jgi:hypothetical protein